MCMCVLKFIVCLYDCYRIKEPILEEEPNVTNDSTPDGEHLSEDEGKSH
jgi:hypothetical protein